MAKFKIMSGKHVCAILAEHRFIEVRRRGSHIVMQRKLDDTTITVPVPDHPELKIGTLASIIRQSGLERELFSS